MIEPQRDNTFNVNTLLEPGLSGRLSQEASRNNARTMEHLHAAYDGPHFPWLCGNYYGDLGLAS